MLKGKAKADYQREYMRNYRLRRKYPPMQCISEPNGELLDPSVRPKASPGNKGLWPTLDADVVPEIDADGNPMPKYT